MVPRAILSLVVVWILAAAEPGRTEAQAVAGRLVDRATRGGINGVIVMLADTAGAVLAQTVSDAAGEFLVNLERPGRYRLDFHVGRTRLGNSETFDVGAGGFHQRIYMVDAPREEPVYLDFQVAKQVSLLPPSGGPRYPPELRARGVEGKVVVQFVVDTAGRAVRGTFRVLESNDAGFAESVERFIWSLRFVPAELKGGMRVRQLVQMPFEFSLGW